MTSIQHFNEIHDGEDFQWFCDLHHKPAEFMFGDWRCPDCNRYIEEAWNEFEDLMENDLSLWKTFTDNFKLNHPVNKDQK